MRAGGKHAGGRELGSEMSACERAEADNGDLSGQG